MKNKRKYSDDKKERDMQYYLKTKQTRILMKMLDEKDILPGTKVLIRLELLYREKNENTRIHDEDHGRIQNFEQDYIERWGYTMEEMAQAEKEIQANKQDNLLRCASCGHTQLIRIKDYLDRLDGKKIVVMCNKCSLEMKL